MTYTHCFQSYLDALVDKASNPNVGHVFFRCRNMSQLGCFSIPGIHVLHLTPNIYQQEPKTGPQNYRSWQIKHGLLENPLS